MSNLSIEIRHITPVQSNDTKRTHFDILILEEEAGEAHIRAKQLKVSFLGLQLCDTGFETDLKMKSKEGYFSL